MSTKNQLYKQIDKAIESGELSAEQIQSYLRHNYISQENHSQKGALFNENNTTFRFNLESILSFVGSVILLLGILIIVSFNWSLLNNGGKIFITLGTGVFLSTASLLVDYITKRIHILNSIQIISGLLISFGIGVFVDIFGPFAISRSIVAAIIFSFFAAIYGVLNLWKSKGVFTFAWLTYVNIAYWLVFQYSLDQGLLGGRTSRIEALGATLMSFIYLCVAFKIWRTPRYFFKSLILNIGAIGSMISLFTLVIKDEYQLEGSFQGSVFGEHIYGLLFILFYYLAQRVRSKVLLLSTSIGLFVWLMYMINVRYNLSNNLGISFIIGGLVLIGISFLTVRVGKLFKKNT